MPRIDEAGVAPVRVGEGAPQSVGVGRHDDDVNVIRHQAIGPDLGARLGRGVSQQRSIEDIIALLEEGLFAPIAALGYVVRQARQDEAREADHEQERRMMDDGVN